MPLQIHLYTFESKPTLSIWMPKHARVLGLSRTYSGIHAIMALVETENVLEERRFEVVVGRDSIEFEERDIHYVGSFVQDLGIRHVLEVIRRESVGDESPKEEAGDEKAH